MDYKKFFLDLIIKQLAIKPETIIYKGRINLLYISWNTAFTELSSHTNNFSKNLESCKNVSSVWAGQNDESFDDAIPPRGRGRISFTLSC